VLTSQELVELRGGSARGEDGDVFLSARWMICREALDVGGVVEQSVALRGNVGGVVLAEALQARPAGCADVGAPFRALQAPAAGVNRDAAVHDWDEVGVGEEVEGGAGPGPVDAGGEQIAVCGGEAVRFHDARLVLRDVHLRRGDGPVGCTRGNVRLGPAQSHVAVGGMEEPVEVEVLDGVEVELAQVLEAGAGQGLDNEHADRAGSDDSDWSRARSFWASCPQAEMVRTWRFVALGEGIRLSLKVTVNRPPTIRTFSASVGTWVRGACRCQTRAPYPVSPPAKVMPTSGRRVRVMVWVAKDSSAA
jgi:hypothetical protein